MDFELSNIDRKRRSICMMALILTLLLLSCAHRVRRFPLSSPRWVDHDRNHVPEKPEKYSSGMVADAADKNVFRPIARLTYLPLNRRALNVNALDEVPNSSWFQNRIGFFDLSPEQVARGPCGDLPRLSTDVPWKITAAKPNGAYPGFFIETEEGDSYLIKFDSPIQPGRATSADVIGSKLYWAVGYFVPCNQIVTFRRDNLHIADDATAENEYGKDEPMRPSDIDTVLEKAYWTNDGRIRASASRVLPGEPLGPFRYEGTRSDDPNDHVPHQHRRELRGNRILSAWLHHHDAREQNTLNVWLTNQGTSPKTDYVKHYMIDFGDCLGSRWSFDPLTRRFGYSYFLSPDHALVDLLTLGMVRRPWHEIEINPEAEIFGYFNVADFQPRTWKTAYPNSAFSEMRYDDALWMARILSRFNRSHIQAVVREAKLQNERFEEFLVETLLGRRDVILDEYFTRYAPLDRFEVVRLEGDDLDQSLCFEDIAISHGVVSAKTTFYKARLYGGRHLDDQLGWLQLHPDERHPGRSCLSLTFAKRPAELAPRGARDDHPLRYGVLKIWIHQNAGLNPTSAIHVHFYDLGPERGYRLVGIDRPRRPEIPDNF